MTWLGKILLVSLFLVGCGEESDVSTSDDSCIELWVGFTAPPADEPPPSDGCERVVIILEPTEPTEIAREVTAVPEHGAVKEQ